jgi:preprotein translocase subunit SecD
LSDLVVSDTRNQNSLVAQISMSDSAQKQAKNNALKQNITTLRNRDNEQTTAKK